MEDSEQFDIRAFEKEIEIWAKGVSQEARCAFASQCAARALPNIAGAPRPKDFTGFSFDLDLIRAALTSAIASTIPTVGVKSAASAARSAASAAAAASPAQSASQFTSLSAARSTQSAAFSYSPSDTFPSVYSSVARTASSSIRSVASATQTTFFDGTSFSDGTEFWDASAKRAAVNSTAEATFSANELLNHFAPNAQFDNPLWLDVTWPEEIAENWATLRGEWSTDPAMAFWIDWYEGLLAGRAPDWALWHDIALIDDEHWEAGPEAVAREIEILQAAHNLDEKIDRFEAQLLQLASEPVFEGNRDNGGPPIEDISVRLQTIELIKEQLGVLKAEAEKAKPNSEEDPDPEVILTAIEKLKELVKKHFIIATVATTIGTTCVVNIVDSGFERYHVSEAFYETFEAIPSAATKLLEKLAQRPSSKPTTSKPRVDSTSIDI